MKEMRDMFIVSQPPEKLGRRDIVIVISYAFVENSLPRGFTK